MLKKILLCLIMLVMLPSLVYASDNTTAKIGDNYYDNL